MQRLPNLALPPEPAAILAVWQAQLNELPTFGERVEAAKGQFESRNRKGSSVFDEVKRVLAAMCSGVQRCAYCEDSAADEVEHVYPKHFYPDRVFAWGNYVYACGPCNAPKGSRFAVLTAGAGSRTDLVRTKNSVPTPPPSGVPGLIDPRVEDATLFMELDLLGTFWFRPRSGISALDQERAEYTIATLGLNARELLPRARRAAYLDYRAHLSQYSTVRAAGQDAGELERLADEIRTRQHPTVWSEMKRQHARLPQLIPLFAAVPEALTW